MTDLFDLPPAERARQDIRAAYHLNGLAYETLTAVSDQVRWAIGSAFFRQEEERIKALLSDRAQECAEAVVVRLYKLDEPGFTYGRGLVNWRAEAHNPTGNCGVYALLERIDAERDNRRIPALTRDQRNAIATGLWIICENQDIRPRQIDGLMRLIDPAGGDRPVVTAKAKRLPRQRVISTNTEVMSTVQGAKDGEPATITLRGSTDKSTAVVTIGKVQRPEVLLDQDFQIMATAYVLAKRNPIEAPGGFTHYAVTLDAIAKAYFPTAPKITDQARTTIRESLGRSSQSSLDNVDFSDAIKKGRLTLSAFRKGKNPLWPGVEASIVAEAGGVRRKGEKAEIRFVDGYLLDCEPILCTLDESLKRIRPLARKLRPSIPYDAKTEEIFVRMVNRLNMVSDRPLSGKMSVSDFYPAESTADDRQLVRKHVETILKHWEDLHVAHIEREHERHRNGAQVLTAFDLRPPKTDLKGHPIEMMQALEQMITLIREDDISEGIIEGKYVVKARSQNGKNRHLKRKKSPLKTEKIAT